jgi:hypothetical protein
MRRAALVVLLCAAAVAIGPRADAACHSFTVKAAPSSVPEGAVVTVTVSRDGAASPSDVHVSTVNGSAQSPADYSKLDTQVEFTSETSKTFQISITNDSIPEGAESFRVHLSDPGGCTGSGYELSNDAVVTIRASDPTPVPTLSPLQRPTVPPATRSASPTVSATPSPTPTTSTGEIATPSPTFSPSFAAPEESSGPPVGPIIGVIVGVLAAGTGAWLLWYRRRITRLH